jgi:undecaprenyl-phosphate galactose phosphotransferase
MFKKRIYIVGNNRQKRELRREFRTNWYFGYKYDNNHFDALIVASQGYRLEELDAILRQYSKTTKDLYVVPYLDTINFAQADIVEYLNIRSCAIHVENKLLAPSNIYTKTVAEFLVSLLLLPIFLVMHIFISAMIVLDSKGLVMFKQQRLGRNKESFECYKYRTMYLDGDDILTHYLQKNPHEIKYYEKYHKYQNDPRVTPIGNFLRKTSLDELPQIINVLQGKMSFIGPRPYMIEEKAKLTDEIDAILCVKPGITGLWQVSGRNELDFEERKRLDVWYIRNWSLWLDAVILIKTIKVVLFKIGAK